ncbi:MAG: SAM-dependent chlorinase/fluorinase [Bacteroidales bacterium]|nr:SAM-dependent chlorinase/fluorinase [Bacteroidales bacterium]
MVPVITLTTDWGMRDHYAGAVKGAILTKLPEARIVDITHHIPPFDVKKASFILRNSFSSFPEGSIHIVGVNTEESEATPHVAIEYKGHYFIGADNGVFTLMFNSHPEKIVELTLAQDTGYFIFSTRDRFVKAAVHLANGGSIDELGDVRSELKALITLQPQINGNSIAGRAIYIDNYENVFINITAAEFTEIGKNRRFTLIIKGKQHPVSAVRDAYGEVPEGEIAVLFSTTGFLEIAINKGNAASLLGIKNDDVILIEFR